MPELKKIPEFINEAEERKFWEIHDSSEYLDWDKSESASFPNLKTVDDNDIATTPAGLAGQDKN